MTKKTDATRRSFLKGGALLAAPLATAVPVAMMADDGLKVRLARLEDDAAIRELHQAWLRRVNSVKAINTGASDAATPLLTDAEGVRTDQVVRSIAADHAGEPDAIEIAAYGSSAVGRFHCAVEIENTIAQDCTLAQMAHEQGGGYVRRQERRVVKVEYVKAGGAWAIAKVELTV